MLKNHRKQIFFLSLVSLVFLVFPLYFSLADTVNHNYACFSCEKNDQACCDYASWWYTTYYGPNTYGTKWTEFYINVGLLNINTKDVIQRNKNGVITRIFSDSSPTDVCVGDLIEGDFDQEGSWNSVGGFMDTPFINWVNNIYDYYYASYNGNPINRKCALRSNTIHDKTCPFYSTLGYEGNPPNIRDYCNDHKEPYNDPEFSLPTYLTYYSDFGGQGGDACVGTQVNCDRTVKITTNANITCNLKDASITKCTTGPGNNYSCALKGKNLHLSCTANSKADLASIKVTNTFNCFAYLERGFFSKMSGMLGWKEKGQGPPLCDVGNTCWCEDPNDAYCVGLYYPLKLRWPAGGYTTESSYYLKINDCSCSIGPQTTAGPIPSSPPVPININYTASYSFGSETPTITEVLCNDEASYSGGGNCSNSTCSFTCNNYKNISAGSYPITLKLHTSLAGDKDCPGTLTISAPPTVSNWSATTCPSVGGDVCTNPNTCCSYTNSNSPDSHLTARIDWEYSLASAFPQKYYRIQVSEIGNFEPCPSDSCYDTGEVSGSCNPGDIFSAIIPGPGEAIFRFTKKYYYRLKVWDSQEGSSNWTPPSSYPTFNFDNPWPKFDFKCNNQNCDTIEPNTEEIIQFINDSTYTDFYCSGSCSYLWNFNDKAWSPPIMPTNAPTLSFSIADTKTVTLKRTDQSGRACCKTHSFTVGGTSNPTIEPIIIIEVPPDPND